MIIHDSGRPQLCADASDFEWPPGRWPQDFTYLGVSWRFEKCERKDGEVLAAYYGTADGRELIIFND